MEFLSLIDKQNIPQHIAIIMDGNGRWAKQQGEERLFGHSVGVESVREALNGCKKLGTFLCPKCKSLGITSYFCSQTCFNTNYQQHKIMHKK